MTISIQADRIQLGEVSPRTQAAMLRLSGAIELDPTLHELLNLRASQINGCAFCMDMHWKDARAAGESEERLYSLFAWRESSLYSERERAALELCEAMTLISEGHVPDEVWQRAAERFPVEELAQVVFAIATINTWNRLAITSRVRPGQYQAGQVRELQAAGSAT